MQFEKLLRDEITLDLSIKNFTETDIPPLMAFLNERPKIKKLVLAYNYPTRKTIELLAEQNTTVDEIDLGDNRLDDEAALAFINKNKYATKVGFYGNRLSDDGVKRIAQINETITDINLGGNNLTPAGVAEFAKYNNKCTTIRLGNIPLGSLGGKLLAENNSTALTIVLNGTNIDDDQCATAFIEHNNTATNIDLSHNNLTSQCAASIAEKNKIATTLNLSNNDIRDEGAELVAKYNATAVNINLSYNGIGNVGFIHFAKNNTKALNINFAGNKIDNDAMKVFSQYSIAHKVDLGFNKISDDGAIELVNNGYLTDLKIPSGHGNPKPPRVTPVTRKLLNIQLEKNKPDHGFWSRFVSLAALVKSTQDESYIDLNLIKIINEFCGGIIIKKNQSELGFFNILTQTNMFFKTSLMQENQKRKLSDAPERGNSEEIESKGIKRRRN